MDLFPVLFVLALVAVLIFAGVMLRRTPERKDETARPQQ